MEIHWSFFGTTNFKGILSLKSLKQIQKNRNSFPSYLWNAGSLQNKNPNIRKIINQPRGTFARYKIRLSAIFGPGRKLWLIP